MTADPFLEEEDFRVLTPEAFDFVLNNELKRAVRSEVPERAGLVSWRNRIARSMIRAGGPLLARAICAAASTVWAPANSCAKL